MAHILLEKDEFVIKIEDEETVALEKTVYVFVIGDVIVRIGSSKGVLRGRFRAWERDITRRIQGYETSTPEWEAKEYRERLEKHGEGIVFARQGTEVTTSVGTFPAYMDEESILIGRHLPPLNRSKHR